MDKDTIKIIVDTLKTFAKSDNTYIIINTEKDNEKLLLSKDKGNVSIQLEENNKWK